MQCLLFALDAVHRFLHGRIEILHADTDTVKTQLSEQSNGGITHLARVNLDGVFAIFHQLKILANRAHYFAQLVVAQERGGAAAEVQLLDAPFLAQQGGLHFDFLDQVAYILISLGEILGDNFIAGAIEAQGITKGDVDV